MKEFDIILTSNGFNNNSRRCKEIDKLFEKISKNKKVLLIVNATKTGSNLTSRQDVKDNFEKVGAKAVELIELDNDNVNSIFDYDILYGMGGDIKPILEDFQKCNFRQHLVNFLERGIYIGESAGSIVLADDVKWAYDIKKGTKPKYDVALNSYQGMGLTSKNILPHFNSLSEEIESKVSEYEKMNNIVITRLKDGEFIFENI